MGGKNGKKWEKQPSELDKERKNGGQEGLMLLLQRLLKSFAKSQRFKFDAPCPRGDRQHEEGRMEPRAQRNRRPGELQPRPPFGLSSCPAAMTERNRLYYRHADIKLAS